MKKVYDANSPLRAIVATLFDDTISNIPPVKGDDWENALSAYVRAKGYTSYGVLYNKNWQTIINPQLGCYSPVQWSKESLLPDIKSAEGIEGLFYARVLSPQFSWKEQKTHPVIIDKGFNIVFDPCMDNLNILSYPLSDVIGYNGVVQVYLINKMPCL